MRALPDDNDDSWLSEVHQAIGDRVRTERLRQNLTQDEVWQAAHIDRRTLQHVEAGRDVKVSTLARIARVLDVPLSSLMQ
ncbi:helix-turn-helix transcriptional regulator [Streptomyces sp. NPDC042207]|uniref:helix-turn-helix domain-containing protein n=1 Tax=Streptomyces sp. NPDC042207 TaxID=3154331 RepID=UPI003410C1E7